jgi:GrpB-like predicted nucleotidyltransferase (UPF0157 family)
VTSAAVTVVDPDPLWPAAYAAVAAEVAPLFGPSLRAIEHVGSTAVPGLPAKPVIDVMAALDRLEDAPLDALDARGFALHDTGMRGRLFLRREPREGALAVHLHLVPWDSFPSRKERRFRDRLRTHPEEAQAYGTLKRRLAKAHGTDADAYTRAKTALIQQIMDRDADARGLPREDVWED